MYSFVHHQTTIDYIMENPFEPEQRSGNKEVTRDEVSQHEGNNDGIDRRGFLECMAWAGTGVLWMMSGGILKSYGMSQVIDKTTGGIKKGIIMPKSDFSF